MFELWVFFEGKWVPVFNDEESLVYANYPSAKAAALSWSKEFTRTLYRIYGTDFGDCYTFLDGRQIDALAEVDQSLIDVGWRGRAKPVVVAVSSVTLSNGQTYSLSDFDRKAGSF